MKIKYILLITLLSITFFTFKVTTNLTSALENEDVLTDTNTDVSIPEIVKDGKSAILLEASTGEILYEKNAHERRAPASMTKIPALYLILEALEDEKIKWDQIVTVSENAASMGGSQIFLQPNEQMSVEDLFKSIALASANDSTVALGELVAGTEELFVSQMNELAKSFGLENTNFQNPTGLTAENHYSSAHDMALMGWHLLKDYEETITKYTSKYEDYIRQETENPFWLVNTNKLVRFEPGVDGLKTGFTEEAGYCLTATKKMNEMRVIGTIMGASTSGKRNAEMKDLLNYGFANYELKEALPKGVVVYEKHDIKYKNDKMKVETAEPLNVLVKKGGETPAFEFETKIFNFDGGYKAGDIVGEYIVYKDGKVYQSIPLITKENIRKMTLMQMLLKTLKEII